jgi:asparagine synthase (glutamine-hydrolysing)
MCGIAGEFHFDGSPVNSRRIWPMIELLWHRGPDDSGVHVDGEAGLGHTRLSIIDLAGGGQPMRDVTGNSVIVFNGEIFNFLELRDQLQTIGYAFASNSDTEVILALYDKYGPDCVHHLNGQWAFAIWDTRNKRLFLSRDRLGVRPLYYTILNNIFLFASEIKAFLACPELPLEVNSAALSQVFTYWFPVAPRTIFKNVFELPPGHSMLVKKNGVTTRQYWQLDLSNADHELPISESAESRYSDELQHLLTDATRIRMRADVPVGAYLSGGLDSSIITALAQDFSGSSLSTFSLAFDDPNLDERSFQNEVALALGTNHHALPVSTDSFSQSLPDVIWHTERPILRMAPVPMFLLSAFVHQRGFKVVLTGEGADELLGGYDIYKETKIREFAATQPNSIRRSQLLTRLYPYLPDLQNQPLPYLKNFFAVQSRNQLDPFFSHLPRWHQVKRMLPFFSASTQATMKVNGSHPDLLPSLPANFARWKPFQRAQFLEAALLLPGYLLSSQGDRVAMAHSLEARYPFLDHRLIEFAARLPAQLKMKVLQEKYLLKRAFGHRLPPAVTRRHKQPYRAPDAASLFDPRTGRARHPYIDEMFAPDALRNSNFFEPSTIARLVERAKAGEATRFSENAALIGILSTQLLLNQFVHRAKEKVKAHAWANRERSSALCN